MAKNPKVIVMIVVGGLFSYVPSSRAALVVIEITGEVTAVIGLRGPLEGKINLGDTIIGKYTYDATAPDLDPSTTRGVYEFHTLPYGVSLEVGGFQFKTNPDNVDFTVKIWNDADAGLAGRYDGYLVASQNNLGPFPDVPVDSISLGLIDWSAAAISNDVLPTTAPVLDHWERPWIMVDGWWAAREPFGFDGNLTSGVLIPEPVTILLLGVGALALLRTRMSAASERRARL